MDHEQAGRLVAQAANAHPAWNADSPSKTQGATVVVATHLETKRTVSVTVRTALVGQAPIQTEAVILQAGPAFGNRLPVKGVAVLVEEKTPQGEEGRPGHGLDPDQVISRAQEMFETLAHD